MNRQVNGWIDRYHRSRTDEIPKVEFLTRWLADHIPESPAPTIIHNDFKLNNMLLDPEDLTKVVAVLDWEMTTVGDPLFDLAVSLSYWVERDDPEEMRNILPTVTTLPGFMTRAEMMELYARLSGRDLSSMHFYMTFAYFKLAVILQQIDYRWKRGQTGDRRFASFGERVRRLIQHAAQLAERGKFRGKARKTRQRSSRGGGTPRSRGGSSLLPRRTIHFSVFEEGARWDVWKGRVAMITGASRGIGFAAARRVCPGRGAGVLDRYR